MTTNWSALWHLYLTEKFRNQLKCLQRKVSLVGIAKARLFVTDFQTRWWCVFVSEMFLQIGDFNAMRGNLIWLITGCSCNLLKNVAKFFWPSRWSWSCYVPDYCYLSYRCSHVYDKHHLNCPYLLFIWVMIDYESLEGWASRKVIKTQVITRIESGTAEFSSSSVTLQLVMINASFSRLL